MTPNKVVIAGSGSWGSALACAASRAGNDTHSMQKRADRRRNQ